MNRSSLVERMTARVSEIGLVTLAVAGLAGCDLGPTSGGGSEGRDQGSLSGSGDPAISKRAAGGQAVDEPWFEDATEGWGLMFRHSAGDDPSDYFMPRDMGSGAAVLDFDQDGLLDVYLVQNAGPEEDAPNRLYRQSSSGGFEDVTQGSGADLRGFGMGAIAGDVNNDGFPDLVVTEYRATRLLLNLGGERFEEITAIAGLNNPHWAMSASFVDYDRDGWLDLVVANYVSYQSSKDCRGKDGHVEFCGPDGFPSTPAMLFRNLGPGDFGIRFEDVSLPSGVGRFPGPGLGVTCLDFNGDHRADLFFADDAAPNRLLVQRDDGTFAEEAVMRGIAFDAMGQARADMGIAVGDVDGDGAFDVFVTHLVTERHTLWRQGPAGVFTDQTGSFGLNATDWRGTAFGTVMVDFDRDGWMDLSLVNGSIDRQRALSLGEASIPAELSPFWQPYVQRSQLFRNEGGSGFRDISESVPAMSGVATVGRGLTAADFNNDGAMDLLITSIGSAARLLLNVAPDPGHWLRVRAIDPSLGGRDMIGSEVTVIAGTRSWRRWLNPAASYLCSHDPRLHFGLGDVGTLDRVEVRWPDGSLEVFPGGGVDRSITLARGAGHFEEAPGGPDLSSQP